MSQFDTPINGFRYALTRYDDTLPEIASRELDDAERWPEIVWMNGLVYPYITNDPASAGNGVLLAGQQIMVPATQQTIQPGVSSEEVYGRDIALENGLLSDDGAGDWAVVSGLDNLKQQLANRIDTPRGELIYHKNYGCSIHTVKGETLSPARLRLSAGYVQTSLLEDYRVAKVIDVSAQADGDADVVTARLVPIVGNPIDIVTRN